MQQNDRLADGYGHLLEVRLELLAVPAPRCEEGDQAEPLRVGCDELLEHRARGFLAPSDRHPLHVLVGREHCSEAALEQQSEEQGWRPPHPTTVTYYAGGAAHMQPYYSCIIYFDLQL